MLMQKDTWMRYILQENKIEYQKEMLFDATMTISLAEELRLQNALEQLIEDAKVFLLAM